MIWILSEEDSIAYLEGGWDAYHVEEMIVEGLLQQDIHEVVAVVLCDNSAIAFYVGAAGDVL